MTTVHADSAMLQPPATEGAHSQKGSVLVEFSVILPILLVILFGVVSFSIALYNKTVLTNATRAGARAGVIFFEDRTNQDIIDKADSAAYNVFNNNLISFGSGISPSVSSVISGNPIDSLTTGDILTVTTSINYTGIFVIYDFSDFLISAETSMRIEP